MLNKCENCGQIVADTDSECWHCGQALTPTKTAAEALAGPDVGMVLRYVGLTAVSLFLLILTTRAIGQAPLLSSGGNVPLVGWQAITDNELHFTLNLPDTWQAIDLIANPAASETAPLPTLAASFAALVADSELLIVGVPGENTAVSQTNPAFILVAQSQRLSQITAEQFVSYAQQQLPDFISVQETNILNSALPAKGQMLFDLRQSPETWRCQAEFVPTAQQAYLVVTCAKTAQFSDHQSNFAEMFRSFQPLEK